VADLLNIANPNRIGGLGEVFRFPFTAIEDVVILDDRTIGVLDSRSPRAEPRASPTNNEFIVLRLDDRLGVDRRIT